MKQRLHGWWRSRDPSPISSSAEADATCDLCAPAVIPAAAIPVAVVEEGKGDDDETIPDEASAGEEAADREDEDTTAAPDDDDDDDDDGISEIEEDLDMMACASGMRGGTAVAAP